MSIHQGGRIPALQIRLPNGMHIMSDGPTVHDVLSRFVGRQARITTTRTQAISVERLDPLAEGEVIADIGGLTPQGRFADYAPLHLITTATLRKLRRLNPPADFDERRFRPKLVIDIAEAGASPNGTGSARHWRSATCGRASPIRRPAPLTKDRSILRTLVEHSRLAVALLGGELLPCAGVYAFVTQRGTVSAGDLSADQLADRFQ